MGNLIQTAQIIPNDAISSIEQELFDLTTDCIEFIEVNHLNVPFSYYDELLEKLSASHQSSIQKLVDQYLPTDLSQHAIAGKQLGCIYKVSNYQKHYVRNIVNYIIKNTERLTE